MRNLILIITLLLSINLRLYSQQEVLQIFDGKNYTPVPWSNIKEFGFDEEENVLNIKTDNIELKIKAEEQTLLPSGISIPHIEINTDEFLEEIPNKNDYKSGDFLLQGFGIYEDIEKRVDIRGRGNTSWGYDKKPYRLKFDKKVSLCGLPSAKSYVLLANYTDCSQLQNALAFKIGQMLDLPFTNKYVPVDVTLNGIYKGTYLLTNKPGINAGSVDIDEDNSIMWELDVNYDEELRFKSPILNLPVMVADPDLNENQFEYWKNDFIELEKEVVNLNASQLVDMDVAARYLLVYEILKNDELGWPKSIKLFKSKGGKYIFGPIWDFDLAMGKVWMGDSYTTDSIEDKVWKNLLFLYLVVDPSFIESINRAWGEIRQRLPEIMEFIEDYAVLIRNSAKRNQQLWSGLEDFESSIVNLNNWLTLRFEALDKFYYVEIK